MNEGSPFIYCSAHPIFPSASS